jgi:NADPH2:quinone reductase
MKESKYMKIVRVHEFGGPEALQYEDAPVPDPSSGEARVRIESIGLNFIDCYHRKGLYPGGLPVTPGMEAAGVVDAVGSGTDELKVGDRVAYATHQGSYAEYTVVPAGKLVPMPDEVSTQGAAAVMLQGMTAHYLAFTTYPLGPTDTALVHAAAGGVGLLLTQMAKRAGARVIGTASTDEKAALAKQAGADEIILYTQTDFEEETHRLTDNQGVNVVYDSVAKTTFEKGLNCLKPRGYMVLYGQSSGPVSEFNPQILNQKGSLFLTRPSLTHYADDREELLQRSGDLFRWMSSGELNVRIDTTFALGDAAAAHRYIEGRQTKGKVLLIP